MPELAMLGLFLFVLAIGGAIADRWESPEAADARRRNAR